MPRISTVRVPNSKNISAIVIIVALLAVLGSMALAAQDRFTLKVPEGLAFSEFRGYETWQDVAVSQVNDGLKVIAGNTAMINAYREGIPGNGKPFPEGSMIVKIEWSQKKNPESPYFVMVPDTLKSVSFIEKMPRDSRTRADGDMPSFFMMQRPTRLNLPGVAPHADTRAIRL
jgi:hypothetical protein